MSVVTIRAATPPAGVHKAKLATVDVTKNQWGRPALRFGFAVICGQHRGTEIPRYTGTVAKLDAALGRLLVQLCGRDLEVDEQIDIAALVGHEFVLTVSDHIGADGRQYSAIDNIVRTETTLNA